MREIWTKERCQLETLKYMTYSELMKGSPSTYTKIVKKRWQKELCSHFLEIKKHKYYWTKEKCQEEALKYETRSMFSKMCVSGYCKAWENKWLDDICIHMRTLGNKYKRCIYVYEFSDNVAYIGLTFNAHERSLQHMKRGPISKYLKINSDFTFKKLTEYIDVESAKIKEREYIEYYKKNNWIMLNSMIGGAIGGGQRKWTKEKCQEEALKHTCIKDYSSNSLSYRSAIRNKWLDEICSHMSRTKNKSGYWTKEKCEESILRCKTMSEFRESYKGAYSTCLKNNWDVFSHLSKSDTKPFGYWTKERCQEEALKYTRRSDLQKYCISAYQISINNK